MYGSEKVNFNPTCMCRAENVKFGYMLIWITVLEIIFLFHAEFARIYLFQKYSSPPLEIGWWHD